MADEATVVEPGEPGKPPTPAEKLAARLAAARERGRALDWMGEVYEVADKVGLIPLMRFAKLAKAGVDSDEMEGLAAMYDLLQQCLVDEDWPRFETHATSIRADGDELMDVTQGAIALLTARPTVRPSSASGGPPSTSESLLDDSPSAVIIRMEQRGRPDIAHIVAQAQRSRASA